jgi:hypothetical protein
MHNMHNIHNMHYMHNLYTIDIMHNMHDLNNMHSMQNCYITWIMSLNIKSWLHDSDNDIDIGWAGWMMTLPLEISAPRPAHCIHWRVGIEGWIPAYWKKAGMNSVGFPGGPRIPNKPKWIEKQNKPINNTKTPKRLEICQN